MALQKINAGVTANDGTGTTNRDAWLIFNANVDETNSQLATKAPIADMQTKAEQGEVDELRNTVDGKASQQALNDLAGTVNTKAEQSDLDDLHGAVVILDLEMDDKASQKDLTELTQRVDDLVNTGVDVEALAGAGLKKDGEKLAVKTADTLTVDQDGVGLAITVQEQINQIQTKRNIVVGEFGLMPFRATDLPQGWYVRNGDKFLLSSPQGQALNNLPENYKTDWGITVTNEGGSDYINVPTAFHTDGRAYFDRAVDGLSRQVGSIEEDAIRNITGKFSLNGAHAAAMSGAFTGTGQATVNGTGSKYDFQTVTFNASGSVPTASENRVLNRGLTPVIFLGV